jgi:hypothetical protein
MARTVAVRLLLLVGVAALVLPGVAHASRSQLSVMEDDHLVLYSGPATRERALDQMQRLGVTTLHVLVVWRHLAPAAGSRTHPVFDATEPASYSGWQPFDDLVASAQARGIQILFTPTSPIPDWASECPRTAPKRWLCSPHVTDYKAFVRALGTRYSGTYSVGGQTLPKVSAWSFWNEPNHKMWMRPQTARRNGVTIDAAAVRYRALAQAGIAALNATGHSGDLKLIGETAPGGGSHSTAPVDFIRDVFCLDARDRPLRGASARIRGCSVRPRFAISGISDHPYTYAAMASPSAFKGKAGDAPIGAVGRLVNLLDTAARYGIVRPRTPVYFTEFGFQTHPPDPFGVSLARQAQYLNYSDYVAFRNPRVASVAQYELRDDPRVAVFNTGLAFADGRPKPALAAYAMPIYVERLGAGARVFGLVRAARGTGVRVEIQNRRRSTFRTVATVRTNRWGYVLARVPDYRGRWRLAVGSGADRRYSRSALEGA